MSSARTKLTEQSARGPSLLEKMWDELDGIVDRLMEGEGSVAEDGRDPGRAEGVAYCIALVQTPYAPDMQAVRDAAVVRWEDRQAAE